VHRRYIGEQLILTLLVVVGVLCFAGGVGLALREGSGVASGVSLGWIRLATLLTGAVFGSLCWGVAGCLNLLAEVHQRQELPDSAHR
jgi:hypothetical protein